MQAFPPSSFWSLTVSETGGGRPGPFYHVYDELKAFSGSFCPSTRVLNICEAKTYVSCSRQTMWVQNVFFWLGTPPPSVYRGRHSHDKMDQAFPLHFCILQEIQNWTVGRPGNEAILIKYQISHIHHSGGFRGGKEGANAPPFSC